MVNAHVVIGTYMQLNWILKNVFQTPILSINLAMAQLKHIMLGKLLTQLNADTMNTPEGKRVNSNVPVFPMSPN
jgi:hypothetical protein